MQTDAFMDHHSFCRGLPLHAMFLWTNTFIHAYFYECWSDQNPLRFVTVFHSLPWIAMACHMQTMLAEIRHDLPPHAAVFHSLPWLAISLTKIRYDCRSMRRFATVCRGFFAMACRGLPSHAMLFMDQHFYSCACQNPLRVSTVCRGFSSHTVACHRAQNMACPREACDFIHHYRRHRRRCYYYWA